jgi:hypothetical protein
VTGAVTGVVILSFGDPTDALACVDSLELSDDLDLDIEVVHNGPEDDAFAALTEGVGSRGRVVASGDNLGYAAGNNLGIAHLLDRGCELVWILNPDTLVEPTTLPLLRQHLADVPDCGIVGPRILQPGKRRRIWFNGGMVDRGTGATWHLDQGSRAGSVPKVVRDVDYVTGASMLVRRLLIDDIGPLPTHYFLYYEETDWCLRASDAGWRVMVDQRARMTHHKRSGGAVPTPYYLYYMTRNRYFFARDRLGLDGGRSLDHMLATVIPAWRAKVERRAPGWLASFDEIVEAAVRDARAGIDGRNDAITAYPRAMEPL